VFNRTSHRCAVTRSVASGTVDADEVTRFNQLASGWWNTTTALHTLNRLRVPLIRDALTRQQAALFQNVHDSATPLKGMTVLDVGCGGGILSEVLVKNYSFSVRDTDTRSLEGCILPEEEIFYCSNRSVCMQIYI